MALVGRSPIRIAAAPSTGPQEAMAASLQQHIDELVQKNRTCEHNIRRLQQALQDEKDRGIDAVTRLKAATLQEREEWREGCDSLLASHRIVHLRTKNELDKERLRALYEKEENRRERIAVVHRDYRLTLFQAKEGELEAKVADLEDALEELAEQREKDSGKLVAQYEEAVTTLTRNLKKSDTLRKEASSKVKAIEAELSSLRSETVQLREENAAQKVSFETSSSKLERATLQLEGARTNASELETANGELKRTNADLKRQLDKWQNLDTKGGAEMEEMRKRRIELEVQVKELQGRVKELEKSEKENVKTLGTELKRVEKLRKENDRMADVTEEAQNLAAKAQAESDEAAKELRKAHRLLEKLQSANLPKEQHRNGKRNAHEVELPASDAETEQPAVSEREVENQITPKPRVRAKPAYRKAKPEEVEESAEEQGEEEAPQPRRGKSQARSKGREAAGVRKRKNKSLEESEQEQEQEVDQEQEQPENDAEEVEEQPEEEPEAPPKRSRGTRKGKTTAAPSEAEEVVEEEPKAKTKTKSRTRGKEKTDATDDEEAPKVRGARARTKERDTTDDSASVRPTNQTKGRKPNSRQGAREKAAAATATAESGDDENVLQPKKKKKRLFPPSQPMTFPWDDLPKGDGGLNIPTALSPVKETDSVPARSVFGKVGSVLGWK